MSLFRLGKDNWARTSPTKEGIVFIMLSFIVGFSALNTNNNLLYLIFGVMLSLVVISGIISMINLSRLEIDLGSNRRVFGHRDDQQRRTGDHHDAPPGAGVPLRAAFLAPR